MPIPRRALATILTLALAATATTLAACGGDSSATTGTDTVAVVATTTQLADFARNVGGDRVDVTQLLPPNADPHEYEPTPGDATAVGEADLVLEHGIGLDDWMDGVVSNAGGDATRVVATRGITLLPGDDEEPAGDPHVWLDPRNAVAMVRNIQRALETADPGSADVYAANADRYVEQIEALDAELAGRIATVPESRRKIVTDHDAFGYFARRYGIAVVGTVIPSLSTAAEPAARDLAELVGTIRREGVSAVFSEASVDDRLQKAIADEADATLGDPLYGDTLGPADQPAGTYLGMMRSNMDAIIAGTSG